MAKKSGKYMKDVGKSDGKQGISERGDFGAVAMFKEADSPASVKKMVGSPSEFARIKHDQ